MSFDILVAALDFGLFGIFSQSFPTLNPFSVLYVFSVTVAITLTHIHSAHAVVVHGTFQMMMRGPIEQLVEEGEHEEDVCVCAGPVVVE